MIWQIIASGFSALSNTALMLATMMSEHRDKILMRDSPVNWAHQLSSSTRRQPHEHSRINSTNTVKAAEPWRFMTGQQQNVYHRRVPSCCENDCVPARLMSAWP